MKLIPKLSIGSIQKVLFSPEVIAIGSAAIIAPLIEPHINRFINQIPFFKNHGTLALIIFSIIILLIASKIKGGAVRGIVIGIAGANFFIAIIPAIRSITKRG